MIYDLSKMSDLQMYEAMITNTDSSLYYHRSLWYEDVVQYLLTITSGKWERSVRWFVTNSAKAVRNKAGGFYISLSPNHYSSNDQNIGYRATSALIYYLEECQFIDIYKGFVKERDAKGKPTKTVKSFVQFKEKYLALWDMIDLVLIPNTEADEMIEIRNRETGENKSLRGRNGITTLREGVKVLNDSLKDVSIEFKGKRVATVEYKRVYSNSLQESGRFFVSGGGVQLLPEKYRSKYLTFNGEPVVELDYSSIHPSICYQQMYNNDGFSIYDVMGKDFSPYDADLSFIKVDAKLKAHWEQLTGKVHNPRRQLAKLAILIGMNSDDMNSAAWTLGNKVKLDREKDIADQDFYAMSGTNDYGKVLEAVRNHNDFIRDMFFNDGGIVLQNIDSKIMMHIVGAMGEKGHAVLAYHDSVLVKQSAEDDLRNAMVDAWKAILGDTTFCKVDKK